MFKHLIDIDLFGLCPVCWIFIILSVVLIIWFFKLIRKRVKKQ